MRPVRRPTLLTAALVALGLLATACGGGGDAADAGGDAAAAPAEEAADEAADGSSEGAGTRTVTHDLGESEVPADPQRVVVLDSPHLDAALSLGVTPVGAVQSSVDQSLPAYLGDRVDGIEVVGTIEEPDLEAISTLQPDLILSATVRHEAIYDQLSAIAPTVFTESSGTNWQEGFRVVADALNRAEEGEQLLAEHDARVAEVGEAIGADGTTATIVRFLPGETRLYGPETFSGSVLTAVGFDLGDKGYDPEYSMAQISPEQFEMIEADVVFATTYGEPGDTTRGEFEAVWGALDAVQEGRVHDVDDREWMLGIGLIGADIILDDLEQALGDGA